MQPSYQQQSDNAPAINVARSWLRAVGIEVIDSKVPGVLTVTARDGRKVNVIVATDRTPLPSMECMLILAEEIGSYSKDVALRAFHEITKAIGHGTPMPVDRGVPPTQKEIYGKDIFLTASRHREFRNAPNLTHEKFEAYKPVVMRSCRNFFARNMKLCLAHGYQVDDLSTFAWVWTHNYVHRYEICKPTQKQLDDNQRLLTKYLKNRFGELYDLMLRMGRRVLVEPDVAQIALMGRVFDDNESIERYSVDPRKEAPEEPKTKPISASRRRMVASKLLKANLEALPHDTMVARLKECAESNIRDYVTRREARRQILMHLKTCPFCQEAGISLKPLSGGGEGEEVHVRRNENAASIDPPSVEERDQGPVG